MFLASLRSSFQQSFPDASMEYLDNAGLNDLPHLKSFDIVVLPASHGEITPYEYFFKGRPATNIQAYAQRGAVAAFCSGAYGLLDRSSYRYSNGEIKNYRGYTSLLETKGDGPVDDAAGGLRLLSVFAGVAGSGPIKLCYDGGPGFELTPDIFPLARFANGRGAVVAQNTGEGVVVGFGALADVRAAHLPQRDPAWQDVREELKRTEAGQMSIWDQAMDILARKKIPASCFDIS
ncbi:MAG: hypothetical protein DI551_04795 [Micavibrio aeruginosavorus]|uniref:Biotin-protein ligase N-terminal domain-containing protein n=1 Tax=Micavibrio aeruginosavorus TaxID=349221 RepID=A0A2W5Q5H0_9BACT|nr:MAG: hypothetical protein DI551_04795 [Micavibrio aeruginosavorus]